MDRGQEAWTLSSRRHDLARPDSTSRRPTLRSWAGTSAVSPPRGSLREGTCASMFAGQRSRQSVGALDENAGPQLAALLRELLRAGERPRRRDARVALIRDDDHITRRCELEQSPARDAEISDDPHEVSLLVEAGELKPRSVELDQPTTVLVEPAAAPSENGQSVGQFLVAHHNRGVCLHLSRERVAHLSGRTATTPAKTYLEAHECTVAGSQTRAPLAPSLPSLRPTSARCHRLLERVRVRGRSEPDPCEQRVGGERAENEELSVRREGHGATFASASGPSAHEPPWPKRVSRCPSRPATERSGRSGQRPAARRARASGTCLCHMKCGPQVPLPRPCEAGTPLTWDCGEAMTGCPADRPRLG